MRDHDYHPLHFLAIGGLLMTYLSGFVMLFCLTFKHIYPAYILIMCLISLCFTLTTAKLFVSAINGNKKTVKYFSFLFTVLFFFMALTGFTLQADVLETLTITSTWFLITKASYYGILIGAVLCVYSLFLSDQETLDKKTIPWTVKLSGVMLLVIMTTFSVRYCILFFLDIPLYNYAECPIIFISIGGMFFTIQFLGKYGPFYRSANGQKMFTSFSLYFFIIATIHLIDPVMIQIARLYHYTDQQLLVTLKINHIASVIELIACSIMLICMRQLKTSQYYFQFVQNGV